MDVAKAVKEVKQGKIDFKVDKTGIVHTSIGKVSFDEEKIFDNAKEFIYHFVLSDLENKILFLDSKTLLQEEIQKKNTAQLRYELVGETGPDHDKQFSVEAYLDDKLIGSGVGRTKKAAEQQAAYEALMKLKGKKQ